MKKYTEVTLDFDFGQAATIEIRQIAWIDLTIHGGEDSLWLTAEGAKRLAETLLEFAKEVAPEKEES